MSKTQPSFKSDIPPHLLENATPQDRWIMENMSVLTQKSDWLADEQIAQSSSLESLKTEVSEIKAQTTKTNGRTSTNETDIANLKREIKAHDTVVGPLKAFGGIMTKKWTWIAIAGFFLFVYPWVLEYKAPIIKAIFSFFLS